MWWLLAGLAILVILMSAVAFAPWRRRDDNPIRSLAVLPLKNLAAQPQDDYLGDGLAEELVTLLGRIENLRVVSFSRTRRFRGVARDAAQIGRELGVDAVLEGTLRRAGDRLRMTIHLVQAGSGFELWADNTFDGNAFNLLDTQRQLAETIAHRLRDKLTPAERARVVRPGTANVEAYELLLRAKQLLTRYSPSPESPSRLSQIEIACEMLKRAVELDPDLADAHAWLAYGLNRFYGRGDGAIASLNRALALNPESPVAQMALVFVDHSRGRDREGLVVGKRVLDAHPDDLDAIAAAAEAYFRAGMLDRAIPLYRKALQADPSNRDFRAQLARSYLYSGEYQKGADLLTPDPETADVGKWAMMLYTELGRFEKAMEVAERTTRNSPRDYVAGYFAGCVFTGAGRPTRARQIWLEGIRHSNELLAKADNPVRRAFLGVTYAKLGMREKARQQAQRVLMLNPNDPELLYFTSKIHAILGDRTEAIRLLRQAVANGFLTLGFLDYHRRPTMGMHNLDKDPSFQTIRDELASTVDRLRVLY